jgi:hypothetical protein
MKPLVKKAEKIMAEHADELDNPDESSPVYSMDNPSIHLKALEGSHDMHEGENTFPLPRYAGDVHKVIEHVHGTITTRMRRVLKQIWEHKGVDFYRASLRQYFYKINPTSVQNDVESLPATLEIISKPPSRGGTGGGWAPNGLN